MPDVTYLLTGGAGGIGMEVAKWLVTQGARHLAMVSRRIFSAELHEQWKSLEIAGAKVRFFSADVTDEQAVAAVLQQIAAEMPPLRGVFHLAVVTEGALLTELTEENLAKVMRPKVCGAWNLHSLTRQMPLDHFVLFSSVAGVLSQPGQASYAAANAYLDALANFRQAQGLPGVSMQWGPWTGLGLAKEEGAMRSVRAYQQQGIGTLPVTTALEVLDRLLEEGGNYLVLPIEWKQFNESFAGDRVPRAFLNLARAAAGAVSAAEESTLQSVREKLLEAPAGRPRRTLLEGYLQETLAKILKANVSRIELNKPMGSMGVDSLMALQFVRRLTQATSVKLPATTVFNYPTIRLFAAELARRMEIPLESPAFSTGEPTPAEAEIVVVPVLAELSEEETIRALLNGGGKAR